MEANFSASSQTSQIGFICFLKMHDMITELDSFFIQMFFFWSCSVNLFLAGFCICKKPLKTSQKGIEKQGNRWLDFDWIELEFGGGLSVIWSESWEPRKPSGSPVSRESYFKVKTIVQRYQMTLLGELFRKATLSRKTKNYRQVKFEVLLNKS